MKTTLFVKDVATYWLYASPKPKKKDNYKLQEVEEPRAVPRLIENSGSELRLAPQVDWIQSRLGSQHEQPKMARSRHDLQYE